jgi:hypothetical protein
MKHKVWLGWILLSCGLLQGQSLVKLSLSMVDAKGKGLDKVRVVILYEPLELDKQKPLQYRATSDAQGLVDFPAVEVGRYRICAAAPDLLVLNPCEWKADVTHVTATATAQRAPENVKLGQGVALRVTIEDDDDVLANNEFKSEGRVVLMGFLYTAVGRTNVLPVATAVAKRKNYMAIVPKSTKLTMRVNSPGFVLEEKTSKKRVDEAGQDFELDVLEETKDVVLAAKALKAVGGAK